MKSVPFTVKEVHNGFSEGRGVLYVDDDEVVFEVHVTFLGMFDRGTTTHRFHLTDLDEVGHKRGLWQDHLSIRTRPMELVSVVPGSAQGALALTVKRKHRRDLDALLDRLDLWVT